jgi:cytoskeleton protein RodZ
MSHTETPATGVEPVNEPAAAVDATVGELLRSARQVRKLEVVDIAQTLKLGTRQVEAVENGDWHLLPGQTFIRGIVRNYARLVDIDSAPLMTQLDSILKKPEETLKVSGNKAANMPQGSGFGAPRRDRLVVVFGLVLVVAAALAYFLLAQNLSSLRETAQTAIDSLAQKTPAATEPAAAKPAEPVFPPGETAEQVKNPQAVTQPDPAPAAPSTPDTPVATVGKSGMLRFVADKESWIEVRDRNSRVVFSERLTPGVEKSVGGDGPFSLVIGYAPGVKVYLRGEAIDLTPHSRGDVARLVLE